MSRLAWFPFYVDDFLGGTSAMLPAELGAYLSAMLAQWQSANLQAIPDNEARLARICAGEPFPAIVREKFQQIIIDGKPYLRNKRLADIWKKQKAVHDAQAKAGKQAANPPAKQSGKLPAQPVQNPEPITQNSERESAEPKSAPAPVDSRKVFPEGLSKHPAVQMYWERYRMVPPLIAQDQIETTVQDKLDTWRFILDYWQLNNYRPESIGKMLDKYREDSAAADPVAALHEKYAGPEYQPGGRYCPPLGMTQREWEKVWQEKQEADDGAQTGQDHEVYH